MVEDAVPTLFLQEGQPVRVGKANLLARPLEPQVCKLDIKFKYHNLLNNNNDIIFQRIPSNEKSNSIVATNSNTIADDVKEEKSVLKYRRVS